MVWAKLIISSGEAEVERPEVELEFLFGRHPHSRIISSPAQSDRWRERESWQMKVRAAAAAATAE
jgi:hypothetical protein